MENKNVFPMAWNIKQVSLYHTVINVVNVRQGVS